MSDDNETNKGENSSYISKSSKRASPYSSFYLNPGDKDISNTNHIESGHTFSNRNIKIEKQESQDNHITHNKDSLTTTNTNNEPKQTNVSNINNTERPTSPYSSAKIVDNKGSQYQHDNNVNTSTNKTKYSTNFPTIESQNQGSTNNSYNQASTPNSSTNEIYSGSSGSSSNYDNDPYVKNSTSITSSQNFKQMTDDYKNRIAKLKTRYSQLAGRNSDLVPDNHKSRIRFWYVVKTFASCSYMVYFLFSFNSLAMLEDKRAMMRRSFLLFGGYLGMNLLFGYHGDMLYSDAFDSLFANTDPNDIEIKINEFKSSIIPVKY